MYHVAMWASEGPVWAFFLQSLNEKVTMSSSQRFGYSRRSLCEVDLEDPLLSDPSSSHDEEDDDNEDDNVVLAHQKRVLHLRLVAALAWSALSLVSIGGTAWWQHVSHQRALHRTWDRTVRVLEESVETVDDLRPESVRLEDHRRLQMHHSDSLLEGVVYTLENQVYQIQGNGTIAPSHVHKHFRYLRVDWSLDNVTIVLYPSYTWQKLQVTPPEGVQWYHLVVLVTVVSVLFALYDRKVQERQQVLLEHTLQSNAIVSSLFPEQFRARLFDQQETNVDPLRTISQHHPHHQNDPIDPNASFTANSGDDLVLFQPTKTRLKSFLHSGTSDNNQPLADLFPHCTVLFADISGFTAWSSLRDPGQVFLLLEVRILVLPKKKNSMAVSL